MNPKQALEAIPKLAFPLLRGTALSELEFHKKLLFFSRGERYNNSPLSFFY
jgi:hypothetical protein